MMLPWLITPRHQNMARRRKRDAIAGEWQAITKSRPVAEMPYLPAHARMRQRHIISRRDALAHGPRHYRDGFRRNELAR